jgi:hypothetical protein
MAVSATSKALLGAAGYSTKWHQKRIHRKLDDRDDVVDEALQLIEEHDATVFPVIKEILPSQAIATYSSVGSTTTFTLTFSIGGTGCTATSAVTCVIGGESLAAGKVVPGTNSVVVTITDGLAGFTATPTALSLVPIYLRIDNVLCPVLCFQAIA